MDNLLWLVLGLFLSPAFLYVTHLAMAWTVRLLRLRMPSPAVAIAAIAAGMLAAIFFGAYSNGFFGGVYAALVYGCLAHAYLHLFLMGETARRLHVLHELKRHGPMTRGQIEDLYGAKDMLDARLDRLVAMQQFRREGDRYFLQKMILCRISLALMLWGKILGFRCESLS